MSADGTCDCGRVIQQPPTGRRRAKCRVCSPPDPRDRSKARLKLIGTVADPSSRGFEPAIDPHHRDHRPPEGAPGPPEPGPVYTATLAELTEVGRECTSDGQVVLQLARAIDAGGGTAAGLAAASREFAVAKTRAFDGATKVADVLDGLFGTG